MRALLICLLLCVVLGSCSRQPVRVAAATPPESTAPAAAPLEVERDDAANATGGVVNDQNTPTEPNTTVNPDVITSPPSVVNNQTALIENQGAVGEAPLTDDELSPAAEAIEKDVIDNVDYDRLYTLPVGMTFENKCTEGCATYVLSALADNLLELQVTADNDQLSTGSYRATLDDATGRQIVTLIDELAGLDLETTYPPGESVETPPAGEHSELLLPDATGELMLIKVVDDREVPAQLKSLITRLRQLVQRTPWQPK